MGEARNRGTYEQRKAQAIVSDHPKHLERLIAEKNRAESYDKMVLDKAADIYIESEIMRAFVPEKFDDGKPIAIAGELEPDNGECSDSQNSTPPSGNSP